MDEFLEKLENEGQLGQVNLKFFLSESKLPFKLNISILREKKIIHFNNW